MLIPNTKVIELYNFCKDFCYINGCDEQRNNCLPIYYNTLLVLGKKRTSFLIQHIDYKNHEDFIKILEKVLELPQITTKKHKQGTLIFLIFNINFINMVLDTKEVVYDIINLDERETSSLENRKLGYVLSYPCYRDSWTNKFARLCVKDIYGKHILFANWCQDYNIFIKGIEQMKLHLETVYNLEVISEYYSDPGDLNDL